MNGVGMYQNYLDSFQGVNQASGRSGRKTAGKGQQNISDKPWAVYERTSTEEDIKKASATRQGNYSKNYVKKDRTDRDGLENFTIGKNNNEVKLSDKAQKLLEQLKEKYSNMDFFVANFSTDEEAQRYLSQGNKDYSVVIDPETLEQMAEDEEVFKKYDEVLANAGNTFSQIEEKLGEDAEKVASFGISIDGNGKVNLFAELDKQSVKRVEAQKKLREQKAEEKKEQKAIDEKKQRTERQEEKAEARKQEKMTFRVTGSTIDELVNNIKAATWE